MLELVYSRSMSANLESALLAVWQKNLIDAKEAQNLWRCTGKRARPVVHLQQEGKASGRRGVA